MRINGHELTLRDMISALTRLGGIAVAIFAAGGLAYTVWANADELAARRASVEKIPVIEERVKSIKENQRRILDKLDEVLDRLPRDRE